MSTTTDLVSRFNAARVSRQRDADLAVQERARIAREAREAAHDPAREAAAGLLDMPVREIVAVESTPAGDVIDTGSVAFILVHDDRPDADGKVGLMQYSGRPIPGSPFPMYASVATPPPVPVVAPVEVEEDDGPEAPPMDDDATLALFEAELRSAKRSLASAETDGDPAETTVQRSRVEGLKRSVGLRRAAVLDRELRENPPPPDEFTVRINTASYLFALAQIDPPTESERRRRTAVAIEVHAEVAMMPLGLVDHELKTSREWFERNDLPLPVPPWEPAT